MMWERKQAGGVHTNVIEMVLINDGVQESINQASERPVLYWWPPSFQQGSICTVGLHALRDVSMD